MDFNLDLKNILIKNDYECEILETIFGDELYNEFKEKYNGKNEFWENIFNMNYDEWWSNNYSEFKNKVCNESGANLEECFNKLLLEKEHLKEKIDKEIKCIEAI